MERQNKLEYSIKNECTIEIEGKTYESIEDACNVVGISYEDILKSAKMNGLTALDVLGTKLSTLTKDSYIANKTPRTKRDQTDNKIEAIKSLLESNYKLSLEYNDIIKSLNKLNMSKIDNSKLNSGLLEDIVANLDYTILICENSILIKTPAVIGIKQIVKIILTGCILKHSYTIIKYGNLYKLIRVGELSRYIKSKYSVLVALNNSKEFKEITQESIDYRRYVELTEVKERKFRNAQDCYDTMTLTDLWKLINKYINTYKKSAQQSYLIEAQIAYKVYQLNGGKRRVKI